MVGRTFFLSVLCVGFSVSLGSAWGQETAPELPANDEVTGPLAPAAIDKIDSYVDWWVGRMKAAKTPDEIMKVSEALANGYVRHATPDYRHAYARSAGRGVRAVLAIDSPIKQIQASMALSAMPQITIEPALEEMSRHANPAARYWAVKGYGRAAKLLLIQDGQKMLDTLERLGRTDSGPMLAAVFRALTPFPDARKRDVTRLRAVLANVWTARLPDILTGKDDVIEAYIRSEVFLAPRDEEDKKLILQLLADAMETATRAFMKRDNQKNHLTSLFKEFLLRFENKLAQITEATQAPLQAILDQKTPPAELSTEACLKWNEHWKPALKKRGITPVVVPEASTAPAKGPAGIAPTTSAAGG